MRDWIVPEPTYVDASPLECLETFNDHRQVARATSVWMEQTPFLFKFTSKRRSRE